MCGVMSFRENTNESTEKMTDAELQEWNAWFCASVEDGMVEEIIDDQTPEEIGDELDALHWAAVGEVEIKEYLREDEYDD